MVQAALIAQGDSTQSKYRLLLEVGQGATAVVYLAIAQGPQGFNKLVVLKTLKRNLCDDPELRRMFLHEARLAARLNHPCIVQTYEVVERERLPVIVMEYLEGQPLSQVLLRSQGTFPLRMHLRVLMDALTGLHHAHELTDFDGTLLGLVHRDMTPHNVFVTFDGHVKILDFGIAKLTISHPETQAGVLKGKLRYMPPEQITGDSIDRRADIYAVGAMLWEVAAGQEIWKGYSEANIMNRVLNGEIPSPRTIQPQTPELLEKICMKALSPRPEDRHATAAELEADLEGLLGELGSAVNGRTVGKTIATLFEDIREQTKTLIETQLSKVASLSHEEYESDDAPLLSLPRSDGPPAELEATVPGTMVRPNRGRRMYVGVGLGALALLGGLALARPRVDPAPPPPRPAVSAVAQSPAEPKALPAPPTQARIQIRISASPAEAKLFLDGEPLPGNPFVRVLPSDGTQHIIRAEAPGFEADGTAFTADHDGNITLKLRRAKLVIPAKGPRPGPSTRETHSAAPNCSPPYEVDAHGTKKFKLECL